MPNFETTIAGIRISLSQTIVLLTEAQTLLFSLSSLLST